MRITPLIIKGNWTRKKDGSLYFQIWTDKIPKDILDRYCRHDSDIHLEISLVSNGEIIQ